MRPIFQAELVNRTFGDPGVYVDLKFQRRALLFDIGDITVLPTRKLLRVSDVFVSHTHMDHFAGFDHLLRVCLGRDAGVRIYGPAPFLDRVEHKLAAYTWNLVENYQTDFVVTAHELLADDRLERARFSSRYRFEREPMSAVDAPNGVLLAEDQFTVQAARLDHHGIPSLSFLFVEGTHVNVWKNRLDALGLPTGPWLTDLKQSVREQAPDDTPVHVQWRTRDGARAQTFPLGELKRSLLEFVPGQKLGYVTDVAGHAANRQRLIDFLRDVDLLFIEAVFLAEDREHADRKAHLTAALAGEIAHEAGARVAVPFHFSPRYMGREEELREEFARGWHAGESVRAESGGLGRH